MKKKLRSDSSFAKLSHDDLALVDDMLMHHASYEDVQSFMLSRDIKVSQTSISEYYQIHLFPRMIARNKRAAVEIDASAAGTKLDDATLELVKQRTFELLTSPQFDSLSVQRLFGIVFKSTALDQSAEKIELMKLRASENLLDKAMSDEVQAIVGADESRSEKLEKLTQLLFGDLA